MIALSRLDRSEGDKIVTQLTAKSVVSLHAKVSALGYQVESQLAASLLASCSTNSCKRDHWRCGGCRRAIADFGLPGPHACSPSGCPRTCAVKAARKIFDASIEEQRTTPGWSAEMVELVGGLSDADVLPKLRGLWGGREDRAFHNAIALVLGRTGRRRSLAAGHWRWSRPSRKLLSPSPKPSRPLAKPGKPDEIADALRMLREYCVPGKHAEVRQELTSLFTPLDGSKNFD